MRKRKRNGADDDGSPAPQRRADNNGTTPFWHGDRLAYRKVTGPVYSIDKLFTDKELAMTYNAAALASHKYLLSHRTKVNSNGEIISSASDTESGDHDDDDRDATPAAAASMERVPSHATRSTRGGANSHQNNQATNFVDDRLVGLEALTNFEMPSNLEKLVVNEPKMPPMFMSNYAKPHSKIDANTPTTLSGDDVSSDLAVMKLLRQYERVHGAGSNFDNANGGRKVLEATAFSPHDSRYVAYLRHERDADPDDLRKDLRLPTSSARDEPVTPSHHHHNTERGTLAVPAAVSNSAAALHATPMSRQSSQGGAAMSRQGSNTRAQRKRNQ